VQQANQTPASDMQPPVLAVDPGREKCGVAVVTAAARVLAQEIVTVNDLPLRIAHFLGRYGIEMIILGDRTGAKDVRDLIRLAGFSLEIVFVDEHRSSELGRRRFLLANPGKGWQRLLPIGLREPNQPYDDYVAVILAERYLQGQRSTRIRRQR